MDIDDDLTQRSSPLEMNSPEFRKLGYRLIDKIADFMDTLSMGPVTAGKSPDKVRAALGAERGLPAEGTDPAQLIDKAADLLFDYSLFNGHPRFWGYITSSAAPLGSLAELLAAAVNPNVGGWHLSPMASEIEAQTIRWTAELLNYPSDCGGLFVSGGNMANLVCYLAARRAKAGLEIRTLGVSGFPLRFYCSKETHTWVQKAADISGLGTDAIRWVATDEQQRIDVLALRQKIMEDLSKGDLPFLVIGNAGSVSTGAIDPLIEIAGVCREFDLWFHVDGAYGGFAAMLPDAPAAMAGIREADSIAVDPHKWLYAPLEAGCALVRNQEKLREAFSYHPPYYNFEQELVNYYDLGPQNSRGFKALKVWMALQQIGRKGYEQSISEDIRLSHELFDHMSRHSEIEALTQSLSISTFRYIPSDVRSGGVEAETYLNELNSQMLLRLQSGGEAYISNAVIDGKFLLRACIVNFRTSLADVQALVPLVVRIGREVHKEIQNRIGANAVQ
jgi:aromatic-L-amino-acid decarboxylase